MEDSEIKSLLAKLTKNARKGWKASGIMIQQQLVDFAHETRGHRLVPFDLIEGGIRLKYQNGSVRDVLINE